VGEEKKKLALTQAEVTAFKKSRNARVALNYMMEALFNVSMNISALEKDTWDRVAKRLGLDLRDTYIVDYVTKEVKRQEAKTIRNI
jgi:hypothetical protein